MATLYVQEYAGLAFTAQGDSIPVPAEPPLASYTIAIGVAAPGPQYQPATQYVTVENDAAICSVRFDGAVATVTDKRLPASLPSPLLVCVAGCNPSPNPHSGAAKTANVSVILNT